MSSQVLTVGEALAIFRSEPDEPLWRTPAVKVGTGGAEANVAMSLAHLGVDVTWAGRVGDDALGRRILRELRAAGVRTLAITDPDHPTGLLVKEIRPGHRTDVTNYRQGSAGSHLQSQDIEDLPITWETLVHVTGISPALSRSAATAIFDLVDRAVRAGARVSFDVNHRPRLWATSSAPDFGEVYRRIASSADVIFVSIDEVQHLLPDWDGSDPEEAAAALANSGATHVVVTAGAAGSVALHDGALHRQPALPALLRDSVGAGDAFVAGYLARHLAGDDVPERLREGARLGAAACEHDGDWEGALQASTGGTKLDGDELVSR